MTAVSTAVSAAGGRAIGFGGRVGRVGVGVGGPTRPSGRRSAPSTPAGGPGDVGSGSLATRKRPRCRSCGGGGGGILPSFRQQRQAAARLDGSSTSTGGRLVGSASKSRSGLIRQQMQQRVQFSTNAQHHPTSASGGNQLMMRNISNSALPGATPTRHPILRLLVQSLHHTLLKPRSIPLPRYISPQHFTFTLSECFGHSSFILVAASYATQDFLELRILAVVGSTSMLFFTYFHPHGRVLWLPLKWNVLFIAINSYRIGKVFYDRYLSDQLSDELKGFRDEHLSVVDKVDYWKLVSIAKEEVFEEGDLVLHQGRDNHYIRVILEGELEVLRDGTLTYVLEKGNFVSESGLHAGLMLRGSIESCATIVVGPPFDPSGHNNVESNRKNRVRCLRWNRTELMDLLEKDRALDNALKAALSWDVVRKLKMQRHMLTEGRVRDPTAWTKKREDQGTSRYASILQNVLRHPPEEFRDMSEVLEKYRRIHRIDDADHERALARCGWSEEEFRLGRRLGEDDEYYEDDEEEALLFASARRVKRYSSKLVRSLLQ